MFFGVRMKTLTLILLSLILPLSAAENPYLIKDLHESKEKMTVRVKAAQVLEVGILLTEWVGDELVAVLLVGHPKQAQMADGDEVNCTALRVNTAFPYTAASGAEKRVPVFRFLKDRIGGKEGLQIH